MAALVYELGQRRSSGESDQPQGSYVKERWNAKLDALKAMQKYMKHNARKEPRRHRSTLPLMRFVIDYSITRVSIWRMSFQAEQLSCENSVKGLSAVA